MRNRGYFLTSLALGGAAFFGACGDDDATTGGNAGEIWAELENNRPIQGGGPWLSAPVTFTLVSP